jgi:sulfoxide reductase catalytic subunit YedY
MDDIYTEFALEERAYRHRCVEAWARFVTFETFNRPQQAPTMQDWTYPWPYTEGLTMDEATNELAFVATGNYGEPLLKQHGAPIRLVVPWKYGFKSIKSVVRITLTDKRTATFWNTQLPREYAFEGNVEPDVPHPRWSQKTEWMLGTMERHDSRKYNGYGEFVADLYPS